MSGAGDAQPVHATLIAARRAEAWRGVLLRGASGVGKSDLALRALAAGWALVADDRVRLWSSGGRLYGSAPATLAGRVEVRGQGVVSRRHLAFTQVALIVDAETEPPPARDRIPEPAWIVLAGVRLPAVRLAYLEPSAPARLDTALDAALKRRGAL